MLRRMRWSLELYTQSDINSAINITKRQFRRSWNGCTLTEIYYAGDEVSEKHQKWADRNGLDEVIVLISSLRSTPPAATGH